MFLRLLRLNSQLDIGNTIGQNKGAINRTIQDNKSNLEEPKRRRN